MFYVMKICLHFCLYFLYNSLIPFTVVVVTYFQKSARCNEDIFPRQSMTEGEEMLIPVVIFLMLHKLWIGRVIVWYNVAGMYIKQKLETRFDV